MLGVEAGRPLPPAPAHFLGLLSTQSSCHHRQAAAHGRSDLPGVGTAIRHVMYPMITITDLFYGASF